MENMIFGIQNFAYNIHNAILALMQNRLIWGFILGLFLATLIHLIIIAGDHLKHLPHLLIKSAPDSFLHIAQRDEKGNFTMSYTHFERDYNRIRLLFYSNMLVFLIIIGISLLRY